jgi:hypothetical protein
MNSTPDRRKERRYLFFSMVGPLIALSWELFVPLNGDNEIFQSMASDLFRFDWLPYLGSWDQNFPGTVYIHWFSIIVFGNSAFGFRLFDLFVHAAMGGMYYTLLRRWLTPSVALLSVALYTGFYFANLASVGGERETFAMAFLLGGTLLLPKAMSNSPARRPYLLGYVAGLLFGFQIAIRPTNSLFVLCALLFLSFISKRESLPFIVGVLTPLGVMLIPYLLAKGGIEQVYLSTVRYNLELYSIKRKPWSLLLHQLLVQKFFLLPAVIGATLVLLVTIRRERLKSRLLKKYIPMQRSERLLILTYIFSSLLALIVMGKYWVYNFEPIVFLCVPFAAMALAALWNVAGVFRYAVAVILLSYFFLRVSPFPGRVLSSLILHPDQAIEIEQDFPAADDDSVSHYIEHAPGDERVEVASIHAGIRWRLRRMSASRFTTFNAITLPASNGDHPDFQQAWRREYIDSLRSARPYFIVLSHVAPIELSAPVESIHTIPGFDSEILPHYRFDTVLHCYTILRRKD